MIDGLRPYPEMRSSGLVWLGDVPAHWELLRSGRVFREVAQVGFPDLELLSIQSGVGIVKQSGTGRKVRASDDRSSYKRIEPGWLGYNLMNAFFGGIGMSNHEGILSPAYAVAKPRFEICPRYFQYLYQSPNWLAEFNRESYGIMYERNRLYFDRFRMIPTVVPPLDEQLLIVRFLDWHGAQTAKLIRAKKKIIALLNEQKQAIIHRAVTRGLDPNVRLKPSGIPWLGDVPEGWEVKKLKRLARLRSGETITSFQIEETGDYPVYGGNGHRGYAVRYTHDGDFVLIGRQGALCGNIHRGTNKFFASEHAIVAHPRTRYEVRWFEEILRVMNLNQYSIAAAQPGLSVERIEVLGLPVPPVDEQVAIVRWLDKETVEWKSAISLASREIALIQEFRTRLIADVVTGKLDIRAAAASLREAIEFEPVDDLVEGDELDETVDDSENEEVAA
jgi:type I restriction enzyme S subunit